MRLVRKMPGVAAYRQNVIVGRELVKGEPCGYEDLPIDGIVELWLRTPAHSTPRSPRRKGQFTMRHATTLIDEITAFVVVRASRGLGRSAGVKSAQAAEVASLVQDGATLMIGGLVGAGSPPRLVDALVRRDCRGLTVIVDDTARPGVGVRKLIDAKLVSRLITSHIGTNPETQRQLLAGELEVKLAPQGNPGRAYSCGRC